MRERATGNAENGNRKRIDCMALQAGSWHLELDDKVLCLLESGVGRAMSFCLRRWNEWLNFGCPVSGDAIARVERNREAFREVDVSSLPCAEWVRDSGLGCGAF